LAKGGAVNQITCEPLITSKSVTIGVNTSIGMSFEIK
jgi:hypothetical protein